MIWSLFSSEDFSRLDEANAPQLSGAIEGASWVVRVGTARIAVVYEDPVVVEASDIFGVDDA